MTDRPIKEMQEPGITSDEREWERKKEKKEKRKKIIGRVTLNISLGMSLPCTCIDLRFNYSINEQVDLNPNNTAHVNCEFCSAKDDRWHHTILEYLIFNPTSTLYCLNLHLISLSLRLFVLHFYYSSGAGVNVIVTMLADLCLFIYLFI